MKKTVLSTIIAALTLLLFMNVSARAQESVPRFEIGRQFSLLSHNKPTPLFSSPTIVPDDFDHETKTGFGGRFSYNLTDYLAVEAEGNFFPKVVKVIYLSQTVISIRGNSGSRQANVSRRLGFLLNSGRASSVSAE